MIRAKETTLYSLDLLGVHAWSATPNFVQSELGLFTDASSVGTTPPGCKAEFNSTTGEYRITGGGNNMWDTADDFTSFGRKSQETLLSLLTYNSSARAQRNTGRPC
jgi:hypothetical protein